MWRSELQVEMASTESVGVVDDPWSELQGVLGRSACRPGMSCTYRSTLVAIVDFMHTGTTLKTHARVLRGHAGGTAHQLEKYNPVYFRI